MVCVRVLYLERYAGKLGFYLNFNFYCPLKDFKEGWCLKLLFEIIYIRVFMCYKLLFIRKYLRR